MPKIGCVVRVKENFFVRTLEGENDGERERVEKAEINRKKGMALVWYGWAAPTGTDLFPSFHWGTSLWEFFLFFWLLLGGGIRPAEGWKAAIVLCGHQMLLFYFFIYLRMHTHIHRVQGRMWRSDGGGSWL